MLLDRHGSQGGIFELAEAPLVGVGDELDPLRADHPVGQLRLGGSDVGVLVGDEQASVDQALVQAALVQGFEMRAVGLVDLAIEDTLPLEQEAGRITKRGPQSGDVFIG